MNRRISPSAQHDFESRRVIVNAGNPRPPLVANTVGGKKTTLGAAFAWLIAIVARIEVEHVLRADGLHRIAHFGVFDERRTAISL